jgi:hypothetical protein
VPDVMRLKVARALGKVRGLRACLGDSSQREEQ